MKRSIATILFLSTTLVSPLTFAKGDSSSVVVQSQTNDDVENYAIGAEGNGWTWKVESEANAGTNHLDIDELDDQKIIQMIENKNVKNVAVGKANAGSNVIRVGKN